MKHLPKIVLALVATAGIVGGLGCADGGDGLTAEQQGVQDQFEAIMERSGGQWDRLSAEDRDYVVNKLSNGNEQAARRMFEMRAERATAAKGPGGGGAAPR